MGSRFNLFLLHAYIFWCGKERKKEISSGETEGENRGGGGGGKRRIERGLKEEREGMKAKWMG